VSLITNRLFFGILFCLILLTNATASEDRAFFWQVKSGTATVYLLGSIHFADESFYPLRKKIEQAFEESDTLVVEIDMSAVDQRRYQRIISSKGTYEGNDTIKNHISADTYQQLKQNLRRLDMPLEEVEMYRPGIIVLMMTAADVTKMGYSPEMGIDVHFVNSAINRKKILSLETLEEQIDALLSISDEDLLLQEYFSSLSESKQLMTKTVEIWKRGDAEAMSALLFEDAIEKYPSFVSLYENLFFKRNDKMTEKIRTYLEKGGTYFVVAGAGHLVGSSGIVKQLEQAGYRIKRL